MRTGHDSRTLDDPTAVGLVLVEGEDADGEIMEQDGFDVPTRRGAAAISTTDYVAGAMSRTRALANGHRPHAIGVTWSEDSELEASLLLKSLTDAGFDNIVAVRSPEAGEALARGIGRAVGYEHRRTTPNTRSPNTSRPTTTHPHAARPGRRRTAPR